MKAAIFGLIGMSVAFASAGAQAQPKEGDFTKYLDCMDGIIGNVRVKTSHAFLKNPRIMLMTGQHRGKSGLLAFTDQHSFFVDTGIDGRDLKERWRLVKVSIRGKEPIYLNLMASRSGSPDFIIEPLSADEAEKAQARFGIPIEEKEAQLEVGAPITRQADERLKSLIQKETDEFVEKHHLALDQAGEEVLKAILVAGNPLLGQLPTLGRLIPERFLPKGVVERERNQKALEEKFRKMGEACAKVSPQHKGQWEQTLEYAKRHVKNWHLFSIGSGETPASAAGSAKSLR